MNCAFFRSHLGPWLDGELEPSVAVELERHEALCPGCAEAAEAERGWRRLVRASLRGVRSPEGLRERLRAMLDEEEVRGDEGAPVGGTSRRRMVDGPWRQALRDAWRWALPAAAAVMLFAGLDAVPPGLLGNPSRRAALGSSALRDVVRLHVGRLPADVRAAEPERVEHFLRRQVGFPVRPVRFEQPGVRLEGVRAWHVRGRHAAAFYYRTPEGRRVTVVAFRGMAPSELGLARVAYGGRELGYARVGRHTVSVRRAGDVNYAIVGDLDRRRLLRLAASCRPAPLRRIAGP